MKRVCIIGGGLAGLSCAYAFKRRGIDAIVFEASSSAGGRSLTQRRDGFTIDVGAQFLLGPEVFSNTFGLIRELGLHDDILPVAPHAGQLYKRRVYHHRVGSVSGLLKFKGLNIADKALLARMAYLLARYGPALDFHHPERGVAFDNETVAAFIKRELSQNILNYIGGPLISTLFFYSSEETSKLLYLLLAKYMHDTHMYTIRGGIGRIAARLSEEVQIRAGTRGRNVAWEHEYFVVDGERFSDLVIATSGDAVLQIDGLPQLLSAEDRAFFEECRYQRVLSVFVATDRPVDGHCYAVSIPRVEKMSAATISFHDFMDSSRVPDGRGLLAITGGGPQVSSDLLMEDLRALYPVNPIFTQEYEWKTGMPKFPPGRFRQVTEFLKRERRKGLHFCGDYLMGPFVEGAVSTGLRIANFELRI
jgi:oxygen-dependent protoporphyrinogen oxidase